MSILSTLLFRYYFRCSRKHAHAALTEVRLINLSHEHHTWPQSTASSANELRILYYNDSPLFFACKQKINISPEFLGEYFISRWDQRRRVKVEISTDSRTRRYYVRR